MKTVVILPCFNEEQTLGKVIDDFRRVLPEAEIVVFDNNSTDRSVEIAQAKHVNVRHEKHRGKGNVMKAAFNQLEADIYVMVDSDDTYPAEVVRELIQPVIDEQADMVVGTRLENANEKNLRRLHQFGNRMILGMLNWTFRTHLKDILSGYRVMNDNFVKNIPLLSSGFEVETELTLQALEKGMVIKEIPIQYRERPEGSESKLRSFRDGYRIIWTIFSLLQDYRPMTFFSYLAGIFWVLGLIFGGIVIADYVDNGLVEKTPSAILATLLIIIGLIAFISGLIVSTINRRFLELNVLMDRKLRSNKKNG